MRYDSEICDDDAIFEQYKQKRLNELQKQFLSGNYVTINDESEVIAKTKKDRMILHFYHENFKKCQIMDHNLQKVCKYFKDIEFVRIDADIAPTLTSKLEIKTLPFLGLFKEGFYVDHIVGFNGFGEESFEVADLVRVIQSSKMFKD